MLRTALLILTLGLTLPVIAASAETNSPPNKIQVVKTSPQSDADNQDGPINKLLHLQKLIATDISQLPHAQGEMKQFTEYRIREHATRFHQRLAILMEDDEFDKSLLLPLIQPYLTFIDQVSAYYADDIHRLKSQLGKDNDNQTMLALANRERQQDEMLNAKYDILTWLSQLGENVTAAKEELTQTLIKRGDILNSLVLFIQDKLQFAVDEVAEAGKDVTSEQTTRVLHLKERLALTSSSLSSTIGLLDALRQDTTILKQTLFSISGDITQDVLNINVVSTLLEEWWDKAKTQLIDNGPGVMFKLFIFMLILFLAGLAGKAVKRISRRAVSNSKLKFSKLLQDFFVSLSGKVVFALGLMVALSQLGFELGPILAGFGVAGVIIGFALQETLSNFASGMMILIYRPYDVGDLINAAGVTGKVSQMSLVSTIIKTLDNQRLIIPNNKIWGDTINNITVEHQRRVDMSFGIGYGDDIEKTEQVLKSIVDKHPKVLADPAPTIKLHTLGESSVDFIVRPWAKPEDYWDVYWDITREVKMRFDQENISIPFPQRDVHIYQTQPSALPSE